MDYTRLRPAVPLAGALLVATALGVQLAGQLAEQHATGIRDRMVAIAEAMDDPDGLLTLSRGTCPDQTSLIRCLEGVPDPDVLAAGYRTRLSAAAGRTAAAHCETVQAGGRLRSCVVRIDEGDHAVMVSIDTRRVGTPQSFTRSGSVVRIDAI
jgi:hypothetical protein